mgnify:CR=1 FL=1
MTRKGADAAEVELFDTTSGAPISHRLPLRELRLGLQHGLPRPDLESRTPYCFGTKVSVLEEEGVPYLPSTDYLGLHSLNREQRSAHALASALSSDSSPGSGGAYTSTVPGVPGPGGKALVNEEERRCISAYA